MAIRLSNSRRTVELPGDLEWIDKYSWTSVYDDVNYTITGALVVSTSRKQTGRFITLSGGEDFGWLTEEQVEGIYRLIEDGEDINLVLDDNTSFVVRFRYDNPFICQRIFPFYPVFNNVKLNLIVV